MSYNLGIDIGIASVGFALISHDNEKIISCGAHIFDSAENPKDGSSLAKNRRTKRGLRRVIRRRAVRKNQIRHILKSHGFPNTDSVGSPLTQKLCDYDPIRFATDLSRQIKNAPVTVWNLRQDALNRKLTDDELVRVLFHIAKRRGYQSNRKGGEANDVEGKKALSGAKDLQEAMLREGHQTIGAHLASKDKKRNGDGNYENFIERHLLRQEIKKIFGCQRRFGHPKATQELETQFEAIAFTQRPLQSSAHLIGFCSLEPEERRAPKFSYAAELFVLWSKLNNLRIKERTGGERPLMQDEKNRLVAKAHQLKSLSLKQTRKEIELSDDDRFNISYRRTNDKDTSWQDIRDRSEDKPYFVLKGYHDIKDALDTGSAIQWQNWVHANHTTLNEIAYILSVLEDTHQICDALTAIGLEPEQIERLSRISHFSKTVDLSLKAIHQILPFMQQGLTYDKACLAAGYDHSRKENKGLDTLPPFDDIRNPVVNRALAQTRKVINAILRLHGKPHTIIIELARDVGKSFEDRKKIDQEIKKNEAYRDDAKKHIAEILRITPDNVSGEDILRYRLWKEQEGYCPYSGSYISPDMLQDPLATQIDHILPYSRSWNDSYMNKVLCLTSENQNKGNDTPREYFTRSGLPLEGLEAIARKLPRKKAENLLIENFDDEKAGEWKSRALNDTRYIARLLKNHIEQNLDLGQGNRVQARNGALTAHLRGAWGFKDKNRRNDRHHALDAIVVACSTQAMVQTLSNWNKYEARKKHPSQRVFPPKPWPTFWEDAKAAIDGVFISRMPVRRITGAAHQETIRSIKHLPEGERQIIQRVKLKGLTYAMLENIVDKDTRNKALYTILKTRLEAHAGKADKAFATPVFMPVNDPRTIAPPIHSVRIITNEKSGIEINKGLASNGDMVRVDVFKRAGKFHLVPIYVHHFAQEKLPNHATVSSKPEEQWTPMEDHEFLFSLHKNDYVKLIGKAGTTEGYFAGFDRATAAIHLRAHDSDPNIGIGGLLRGLGVKTQADVQKFSVDYFGTMHRILKETRLGLADGSDPDCE